MIKAVIIDDEPLARGVVKHYLKPYTHIDIVQECADGFEGLKAIQEHKPDLIFLDVQMPKISGFEMLELIEDKPAVIFTTAFDEYAIKAFEVNAIDYLLKPIVQSRFDQAIEKISNHMSQQAAQVQELIAHTSLNKAHENRIVVKQDGVIKIFAVQELNYIEANDDYVKINTKEGVFFKNKTMSFYENTLDVAQFVRIHRSYIINLAQVSKIELKEKDSYIVLLKSDIWLPVSKNGYIKLKAALGI